MNIKKTTTILALLTESVTEDFSFTIERTEKLMDSFLQTDKYNTSFSSKMSKTEAKEVIKGFEPLLGKSVYKDIVSIIETDTITVNIDIYRATTNPLNRTGEPIVSGVISDCANLYRTLETSLINESVVAVILRADMSDTTGFYVKDSVGFYVSKNGDINYSLSIGSAMDSYNRLVTNSYRSSK